MKNSILTKIWRGFGNFHLIFAHVFIWVVTITLSMGFYGYYIDRKSPIENLHVVDVYYEDSSSTFHIEWQADIVRGCDATIFRWLTYDDNLTILSNQDIPHLNFTDLTVFSKEEGSRWRTAVSIPPFLEDALYDEKTLDYQIEMRYECNFMHSLRPIIVRSETIRLNIH